VQGRGRGGNTLPHMREGSLFGSFLLVNRSSPSALFLVRGNLPCLGHVGGTMLFVGGRGHGMV